ncbi:HAMP domain-containing sensor histidine kinase [Longirhabdus pacifica]|uniref:HAMP domain-containing sensor histidine kinase n=1 Tax=Longirhabdus pacifica TaxID=2305227 RepID=UPI0010087A02|nr:histidine kinase dimerization/phospho-acceptor domain-containing protein [Longirhabdus pacifica]
MKKSLTIKMFVITFTSFLLFLTGIVLVQSIYFHYFYESNKINGIISNINAFSAQYEQEEWNDEELFRQMNKFSVHHNSSMQVSELNLSHLMALETPTNAVDDDTQTDKYMVTILDDEQRYRDLFLEASEYQLVFHDGTPSKGETITLKGYLNGDETIIPTEINEIILQSADTVKEDNRVMYENEGEVVNIVYMTSNNDNTRSISTQALPLTAFQSDGTAATSSLTSTSLANISMKNDVHYVMSDIPYTHLKQVDFIKMMTLADGTQKLIKVNTSLQSVNEAMNMMKDYLPYFFLIAVLLSLTISVIYSRSVAKPIKHITGVANQMSTMDFSQKSNIKSANELGVLSHSLNQLSSNLQTALKELSQANEQLTMDMQEKEKQEQSRKEFIANASHELKTPLTVIRSYSEGLQDGVKESKRHDYTSIILDEANKMEHLIAEMTELSKLESNQIPYHKEMTEIQPFIVDTVTMIKETNHLFVEKCLHIEVRGTFGIAYVDIEKIKQAFINFLNNAIKYGDAHSTIIIEGIREATTTRIQITNDCPPLSEEQRSKVWDRFYTIDGSHNKETGGSGLGLAITKKILQYHPCRYGVKHVDRGVQFWFELNMN